MISSKIRKKTIWKYIIVIALLFILSIFSDSLIKEIFFPLKSPFLDSGFNFVTYLGNPLLLAMILLLILLLSGHKNKIYPVLFAILLSAVLTLVLKSLITRQRPDDIIVSLSQLLNYSFPSMHTAVVFAVLPVLNNLFKKLKLAFSLFAVLVMISRIYLGYHYFSDVVFGAVLGYFVGIIILNFERDEFFVNPYKFSRQFFHAVFGILLAVMVYLELISSLVLFLILIFGFALSYISRKAKLPLISWFLERLEREDHIKKFPGKGALTFIIGALIVSLFFEKDISAASLMILALGDPVSHVIGRYYGKTKSAFGKKKFVEGIFFGILAGFAGAIIFVKPLEALIASSVAMIAEAVEIRFKLIEIDDNIVIPVVAGSVIYLIRMIF